MMYSMYVSRWIRSCKGSSCPKHLLATTTRIANVPLEKRKMINSERYTNALSTKGLWGNKANKKTASNYTLLGQCELRIHFTNNRVFIHWTNRASCTSHLTSNDCSFLAWTQKINCVHNDFRRQKKLLGSLKTTFWKQNGKIAMTNGSQVCKSV